MNILYFAPFYNTDDLGYLTRHYTGQLSTKHNITVCPVNFSGTRSHNIYNTYNKVFDYYDIAIQHCPYTYINYIPNIKNVWIPIIYNLSKIYDPVFSANLKSIDSVLVDDIYTEYAMIESGAEAKIRLFDGQARSLIDFDTNQKLDLGLYNNSTKYYAILNYTIDQITIFGIIKHFLAYFRGNQEFCLILLVTCNQQEEAQNIENNIKNIAKELKLVDHGNVRIFATQTGSVEDCAAVHNVGDIYVDITKHNNIYQKLLAKQFNSSVVNRLNLGFFHNFGDQHNSTFAYKNHIVSWCSDSYDQLFANNSMDHDKNCEANLKPSLCEIISEL